MKFKTSWQPVIGNVYDTVVNGQIWSFTFDGIDPDDEEICFITWSTGEEETHSKGELLPGIEEVDTLKTAGIVYPRGNSDEDQYQALLSIMTQPTYRFAEMIVPRALVLTCNFAPEYYMGKGRVRLDSAYMGFEYNPEKSILNITSPDPDAELPGWIMDRIPVLAVMRIDQDPGRKNTTFVVRIDQETVQHPISKKTDKGKLIGYTGEECKKCGRVRVELFEHGDKVCEKCGWNEVKEEYETQDY